MSLGLADAVAEVKAAEKTGNELLSLGPSVLIHQPVRPGALFQKSHTSLGQTVQLQLSVAPAGLGEVRQSALLHSLASTD